jgi:hypothetical protein
MKNQEFLVLLDARIEEIARAVFLECDGDAGVILARKPLLFNGLVFGEGYTGSR